MENSKALLSCEQARQFDLVDYLSSMGHEPLKIFGNNYWYLSPLRTEKTASFKVNRSLNRWYDHGIGKGGNLIDFAILYHNCTIKAFLQSMQENFSFQQPSFLHYEEAILPNDGIEILQDFVISSWQLVSYLKQRNIPYDIAHQYCREVRYKLGAKTYYAIGFKNDSGGYELRNPYCKNSSSPKAITTIDNNTKSVAVFEGFFDFLSWLVMRDCSGESTMSFCILNSLSFFQNARPFLEQYASIQLYLDNDSAGQNCSRLAQRKSEKYIDQSSLYKGYKDLNEWHGNMSKGAKNIRDY